MKEQIGYERVHSTLFLRLPPEIDHHSSRELRERTEDFLKQGGIRCIVFDFSRTTFMDSSGVGAILGRYKRMRERGGRVAFCGVDGRIRRILHISGVDKLIGEWEPAGSGSGLSEEQRREIGNQYGKNEF